MTATTERALPGMNGAIHAETPAVAQSIEGDDFNVTIDVSQQVDFDRLARAILSDPDLSWRLRILARNTTSETLRAGARKVLRESAAVRAALTLTLGPSQADALGAALDDASREPARCEWYDDGRGCNNFTGDLDPQLCPPHKAAEDAQDPVDEPIRGQVWA